MTDLEIMKAARLLLTPPGSWIQHVYARNHNGRIVHPTHKDGACFCSIGAFMRINPDRSFPIPVEFKHHMFFKCGNLITNWNDHPDRTHAEVLAEFDEVIAELEAAQP